MNALEWAALADERSRYWQQQRRWRTQHDALASLAERAYDDEDWDVGDALKARADDLLSLLDD